ncbi:MAG: phosphoribosylformylglycinamidine synthase subunit PurL [Oligoflexales bacterium]
MKLAAQIDEAKVNLPRLLKEHKLSVAEYDQIKIIIGRNPTLTELGVFSAMWSEHCSYKSSRVHLKRFPTTGENVVVGPGENAGVVRLDGKLCVAFKMESHNHPSYLEPFQGAATGVGGILRDVFCMGARPVANLNCLRFGHRSHPRTRYLLDRAVAGIGHYGNCVGVPTVGGNVSFDARYNGNCLVNAMTVGFIHEDKIFKGYATGVGNLVVYVGSATGRDGVHGATMASDSFGEENRGQRSAVQVGDPFTEKLLLEVTLELLQNDLVVGLQDMGAAGLTSSSFEMAARAGNGIQIDLDKVPVRADGMTAYELMLSESQERMLMVVEPAKWAALENILSKWDLAFAIIGKVTDTGRVHATYKNTLEIDLPVGELSDRAPVYKRPVKAPEKATPRNTYEDQVLAAMKGISSEDILLRMCRESGFKDPIFTQYDYQVGTKTILSSIDESAAVVWASSDICAVDENLGVAISTACNEAYCEVSPRVGSSLAVLKCAREIYATGAQPLAVTDCLNFGNPEDPEIMHQFSEAVDGISEACNALGSPVVSGNVSLYNKSDDTNIFPTPMIGMVGRHRKARNAAPGVVSQTGYFALLSASTVEPFLIGSLAAKVLEVPVQLSEFPKVDWKAEKNSGTVLQTLVNEGLINACRPVGLGGLALTLSKMCLRNGLGLKADMRIAKLDAMPKELRLFGEGACQYILHFGDLERLEKAKQVVEKHPDLLLERIGQTTVEPILDFGEFKLPLSVCREGAHQSLIS